jgi:hypothetical protein
LVLVAAALAHAGRVAITTCGQTVNRGETGVLMNDLACGQQWGLCRACATCFPPIDPPIPCSNPADCPDPAVNDCYVDNVTSVGVNVAPGGKLYLNGHSISGVSGGVWGLLPDGTAPPGTLRVKGPGTISGTALGIYCSVGRITGVALHDNWTGVRGAKLVLKDVDASRNSTGVNVISSVRATSLIADDNRYVGVFSYEGARLSRSHATGNAAADLASEYAPNVVATVCGHSAGLILIESKGIYGATGPPWGVCSGD